jgi:hypothetical protein
VETPHATGDARRRQIHPHDSLTRDGSGVDDFRIRSDLNYVNMEKSFDIHADVDDPNLIMCRFELGYCVSDIRWIWIIQ